MSVIDILNRVEAICKKYDKYDVEKRDAGNVSGDDAVDRLLEKSEAAAAREKNRAEIRRTKERLMEKEPELQKLELKKVKGLLEEDLAIRNDLVSVLPERIQSVPDWSTTRTKQTGSWTASASRMEIKFDSPSDAKFEEYAQQTGELNQFRWEYGVRKVKQGLDTQVPLIDEFDAKVGRANADLKITNVRLKGGSVNQQQPSCNFCINIILLCVILGIAAYIYNVLKK